MESSMVGVKSPVETLHPSLNPLHGNIQTRWFQLEACDPKLAAARGALELLRESRIKTLGVGTGTTVIHFIELLPGLNRDFTVAASSLDTALRLAEKGYLPVHPSTAPSLDAYVDGADEVDSKGNLVKGRGGALLGEKILASQSRLNIFIVSRDKLVEALGSRGPIPVEVVRDSLQAALRLISRRYRVEARRGSGKMGPVVSDWGGVILDVHTGPLRDPVEAEAYLKGVPGVVETGLFIGYADYVVVGGSDCKWEVYRYERVSKL